MWLAVAIIGMIAIATGITLLPGSASKPQPAASAPAAAAPAQAATPATPPQGQSPTK